MLLSNSFYCYVPKKYEKYYISYFDYDMFSYTRDDTLQNLNNYPFFLLCARDKVIFSQNSNLRDNKTDFVIVYPDFPDIVVPVEVHYNGQGHYYFYSTGADSENSPKLTSDFLARPDIDKISVVCFCFIFLIVFIFNQITRFIKKGGLFSA